MYIPLAKTFALSFVKWNMIPTSTPRFCGFKNFVRLFHTPGFVQALVNTAKMMVEILPFSIILPLASAIFARHLTERADKIYRTLIFFPMIMAPVSLAAIFRWMLHPAGGLVNEFLKVFGAENPVHFLNDPRYALGSIVFVTGLKMMGFFTLLFYNAVANINGEYYEAAAIDGSSFLQRTLYVTLPMISPTLTYNMMLSMLFTASWSFTYVDTLTNGGPLNATMNAYYFMWDKGFRTSSSGLTASSAVLFFLLFGLISLGLNRLGQKISYYDD